VQGIVHAPHGHARPCRLQQVRGLAKGVEPPEVDGEIQRRAFALGEQGAQAAFVRQLAHAEALGLEGLAQLHAQEVALAAGQPDQLRVRRGRLRQVRDLQPRQKRSPKAGDKRGPGLYSITRAPAETGPLAEPWAEPGDVASLAESWEVESLAEPWDTEPADAGPTDFAPAGAEASDA